MVEEAVFRARHSHQSRVGKLFRVALGHRNWDKVALPAYATPASSL
jgi:hypothetical protein